jgi:hypothetical protein
MRRILAVVLVVLTACRPSTAGTVTGASTPESAVNAFLMAAKAQDLQAMSQVWGTSRGAAAATMERNEMERRELVLIRLLCHESAAITGSTPGTDGRRLLRLDMTRAGRTVPVTFTTVQGPRERWYVEDLEVLKLQELCNTR